MRGPVPCPRTEAGSRGCRCFLRRASPQTKHGLRRFRRGSLPSRHRKLRAPSRGRATRWRGRRACGARRTMDWLRSPRAANCSSLRRGYLCSSPCADRLRRRLRGWSREDDAPAAREGFAVEKRARLRRREESPASPSRREPGFAVEKRARLRRREESPASPSRREPGFAVEGEARAADARVDSPHGCHHFQWCRVRVREPSNSGTAGSRGTRERLSTCTVPCSRCALVESDFRDAHRREPPQRRPLKSRPPRFTRGEADQSERKRSESRAPKHRAAAAATAQITPAAIHSRRG